MTQTQQNTGGEGGREEGGEGSCEGVGRRNINETGEKEKYWEEVTLQMLNAEAHVSGSECTEERLWNTGRLKVNSREEWRYAERRLTSDAQEAPDATQSTEAM